MCRQCRIVNRPAPVAAERQIDAQAHRLAQRIACAAFGLFRIHRQQRLAVHSNDNALGRPLQAVHMPAFFKAGNMPVG